MSLFLTATPPPGSTFVGSTDSFDISVAENSTFTIKLKPVGKQKIGITSMRSSFKKNIHASRINYQNFQNKEHLNSFLKKDAKAFWSYIKHLLSESQGIADLKQGDQFQSDSKIKAEILNNQFTSVFTKEDTTNIPSLGNSPYLSIPVLTVSTISVEKQLKRLEPH